MTYAEVGAPLPAGRLAHIYGLAASRVRRSKQGQQCRSDLRVSPKALGVDVVFRAALRQRVKNMYIYLYINEKKTITTARSMSPREDRQSWIVVVSGSLVTPDQSTPCQPPPVFFYLSLSHTTHIPPLQYDCHQFAQTHLQQGADSRDHLHHNPQEHVVLRDLMLFTDT